MRIQRRSLAVAGAGCAAALILICFVIVACLVAGQSHPESRLIGKWNVRAKLPAMIEALSEQGAAAHESINDKAAMSYEFSRDGTMTVETWGERFPGKWSVVSASDERITIRMDATGKYLICIFDGDDEFHVDVPAGSLVFTRAE